MKKILLLLFLFTILPFAYGQDGNVSTQRVRTADPSTCSPSNGGFFFNTTAGAGKNCIATDTWGTQSYLNKVQTWLKAQTFQPDTDATALTLKCFNGTNTASVFLVKDKNDATLFSVDCTGAASFGGTPAVTGTPGTLPTVNTGEGQFGIGSDGEFVVKRVVSGTTQAAQKPAYQPDADCSAGEHVSGVDANGKLKCTADTGSGSSLPALSDDGTKVSSTEPILVGTPVDVGIARSGANELFLATIDGFGNVSETPEGSLKLKNLSVAGVLHAPRSCEIHLSPVASEPISCFNFSTDALSIIAVKCYADAGTPTVQPQITGGSSTSILSSALTCGTGTWASGTLNGSPTISAGSSIDFNVGTASTAAYIRVVIVMQ